MINIARLKHFVTPSKSATIFLVLVFCVGIWSFFIEPRLLNKKEISFQSWSGPPFKIVFFSDLHAGSPGVDIDYTSKLVSRINSLNPDLILIGGDMVSSKILGGSVVSIEKLAPVLGELRANIGVYAVLGNHDWWNNGKKIAQALEDSKIKVLDNKAELIRVSDLFSFWLIGIGDSFTENADVDLAFSFVTSNRPQVLFMHDPAALFELKTPFLFALAGHLHGGQVYFPGLGALYTPGKSPSDWASGYVDFPLGSLYVSKGIGTSILPVRFNALPEYVVIDLK